MAVISLPMVPCRLDRAREHVKRGEPDSNSIRSADCFVELWKAKLPGILERLFEGDYGLGNHKEAFRATEDIPS